MALGYRLWLAVLRPFNLVLVRGYQVLGPVWRALLPKTVER